MDITKAGRLIVCVEYPDTDVVLLPSLIETDVTQ